MLQHVHNQVNEPCGVPIKGDTNCQGVPISLISLRGNEFAHFHGANYRAPSDRPPPLRSRQGTPGCSLPISQIICISFSAAAYEKTLGKRHYQYIMLRLNYLDQISQIFPPITSWIILNWMKKREKSGLFFLKRKKSGLRFMGQLEHFKCFVTVSHVLIQEMLLVFVLAVKLLKCCDYIFIFQWLV